MEKRTIRSPAAAPDKTNRDKTNRDKTAPRFWRDAALPFIEGRAVQDGRLVCYAPHTHETFSIGLITRGHSLYCNGSERHQVTHGTAVIINPDQIHACSPLRDSAWSYTMLYIDTGWLAGLQRDLGLHAGPDFHPLSVALSTDPALYGGLERLCRTLFDPQAETLQKHSACVLFFSDLQRHLSPTLRPLHQTNGKLRRAAAFIDENCTRALTLDDICAVAALSPFYLIRAFKKNYGMTPHAYLVNRRIQYGRSQLRQGRAIADVALEAGFADQAHFQRSFKQIVAATPRQYRAV